MTKVPQLLNRVRLLGSLATRSMAARSPGLIICVGVLAVVCMVCSPCSAMAASPFEDYPLQSTGGISYQPIAYGDLRDDDRQDLVVAGNTGVNVLLGNGDGTFEPAVAYDAGEVYHDVAVAYFQGAGKPPDIIGTNDPADTVSILPGNGDGTFGVATVLTIPAGDGSRAVSLAVGDLANNGVEDFVVGTDTGIVPFLNDGSGHFTAGTFQPWVNQENGVIDGDYNLAIGDVNGDGYPDIVAGGIFHEGGGFCGSCAGADLFLNNGSGEFDSGSYIPLGDDYRYYPKVVLAALTSGGPPDLVAVDTSNNSCTAGLVTVDSNVGGGFSGPGTTYGPNCAGDIAAADMNGDGNTDIVTVGQGCFSCTSNDANGVVDLVNGSGMLEEGPDVPTEGFQDLIATDCLLSEPAVVATDGSTLRVIVNPLNVSTVTNGGCANGGTGGGQPNGASCPPTSVAATLANVAAQICRFAGDEGELAQGEEGLLSVAGSLPHASQLGGVWVVPEGGTLTVASGTSAESAASLMRDALNDEIETLADMAAENLAGALGGCGAEIAAGLLSAAKSESAALDAAEKSEQAFADSTNGSSNTGSDTSTAAGYAELAGANAAVAAHSLIETLDKAEQCAKQAYAAAASTFVIEVEITVVILIHIEAQLQQQEQQDIGLVPLGGYDLVPGLPSNNFTSGATVIIDSGGTEWSGNALSGSLNPIGLSPTTVINGPSLSALTTLNQSSVASVGQGDLISLTGGGYQPNSVAAFSIGSTPMRLAVAKANARGVVSATVQIPKGIPAGHHELYAIGTAPDGSLRVLGTGITVTTPASPLLTGAHESSRRWREGHKLATAARRKRPRGLPVGTTFSFTLNEPARVTLTFTQPGSGRRVKGECVGQTHENRHTRPCKRSITRGALVVAGRTGVNTLVFQGRLTRTRSLKPGRYKAQITAANSMGRSRQVSLTFTIVR
jgi:hypothetical protein